MGNSKKHCLPDETYNYGNEYTSRFTVLVRADQIVSSGVDAQGQFFLNLDQAIFNEYPILKGAKLDSTFGPPRFAGRKALYDELIDQLRSSTQAFAMTFEVNYKKIDHYGVGKAPYQSIYVFNQGIQLQSPDALVHHMNWNLMDYFSAITSYYTERDPFSLYLINYHAEVAAWKIDVAQTLAEAFSKMEKEFPVYSEVISNLHDHSLVFKTGTQSGSVKETYFSLTHVGNDPSAIADYSSALFITVDLRTKIKIDRIIQIYTKALDRYFSDYFQRINSKTTELKTKEIKGIHLGPSGKVFANNFSGRVYNNLPSADYYKHIALWNHRDFIWNPSEELAKFFALSAGQTFFSKLRSLSSELEILQNSILVVNFAFAKKGDLDERLVSYLWNPKATSLNGYFSWELNVKIGRELIDSNPAAIFKALSNIFQPDVQTIGPSTYYNTYIIHKRPHKAEESDSIIELSSQFKAQLKEDRQAVLASAQQRVKDQ